VGGLNDSLPFDYYVELLAGLKRLQPLFTSRPSAQSRSSTFTSSTNWMWRDFATSGSCRARLAARGGARSSRPGYASASAPTSATPNSGCRCTTRHTRWSALQLHHALRNHRDHRRTGRSPAALAGASGGNRRFSAFVPWPFTGQQCAFSSSRAHRVDDLRGCAVSRLLLHNSAHQGLLGLVGSRTAQTAQWLGADDLDAPCKREIYSPGWLRCAAALTPMRLSISIRAPAAPVERDTLLHVCTGEALPTCASARGRAAMSQRLRLAAVSF